MPIPVASTAQLRNAVSQIVRSDPAVAAALALVIVSVIDPAGDPQRFALADDVLQHLFTYTAEFDSAFREYLAA